MNDDALLGATEADRELDEQRSDAQDRARLAVQEAVLAEWDAEAAGLPQMTLTFWRGSEGT